jgi:hypothetical protein
MTSEEWYPASHLAGLPGLPQTYRGVKRRADTCGWKARKRQQRGGGAEYHISSLPAEAQEMLRAGDSLAGKMRYLRNLQLQVLTIIDKVLREVG